MNDSPATLMTVRAGALDVAVERSGDPAGWPVVLLHGFPYDARSYDVVAANLARAGADVVVPYLRGYGRTRFHDAATLRSGQQAALAHDLVELIDALDLELPIVAGYDWGGRAACLVSTLWPERVSGLVTVSGYNVQDIAGSAAPQPPAAERKLWYQYYLHGERGRAGLDGFRADYARQLWREWSPTWAFSDDDFAATSISFDNPDFVEVVVHSYRHATASWGATPLTRTARTASRGCRRSRYPASSWTPHRTPLRLRSPRPTMKRTLPTWSSTGRSRSATTCPRRAPSSLPAPS